MLFFTAEFYMYYVFVCIGNLGALPISQFGSDLVFVLIKDFTVIRLTLTHFMDKSKRIECIKYERSTSMKPLN